MNKKSNYGIFSEVRFINESVGEIFLFSALAVAIAILADRKNKDRENKEKIQKQKEECEKRRKDTEKFVQDCQKHYNITNILPKLDTDFDSTEKVYESMLKDVKSWTRNITNSVPFKEFVKQLADDPKRVEYIFYSHKPTPTVSYFKTIVVPSEGVNGYNESMQIIEGSQDECVEFGWITDDIAKMCEIKYSKYLKGGVSTGDGDEGHIYYKINI